MTRDIRVIAEKHGMNVYLLRTYDREGKIISHQHIAVYVNEDRTRRRSDASISKGNSRMTNRG